MCAGHWDVPPRFSLGIKEFAASGAEAVDPQLPSAVSSFQGMPLLKRAILFKDHAPFLEWPASDDN